MNKFNKKIKGSVLLIVAISAVMLFSIAALVIDVGYANYTGRQLQQIADAAALAGASSLPNTSSAVTNAQNIANANMTGHGTILATSDVLIGTWNNATNTFTTTSSNPTAVKVTIRRTKATSNPVSFFFANVIGQSSTDMTASAVAQSQYPTLQYGIVGMTTVTMSGSTIDSYNSNLGAYSSLTATSNGNVASNGAIVLSGSTIKGNANPGVGQAVISSGSTISGNTTPLSQALSYPSLSAPTSYNNHGLASNLTVSGSANISLTPGTYYFQSITISGSASITTTGPTTIYIGNSITLSGNGVVNTTQIPNNLNILLTSTATTVAISGSYAFYGLIYGPNASWITSGTVSIYGGLVTGSIITSGSAIHRDTNLSLQFETPTVKLVN